MPRILIAQGNGLWANYSTVVDSLMAVNLTVDQALNSLHPDGWHSGSHRDEFRDKMLRGENPWPEHLQMTIREALAWTHHGPNGTAHNKKTPLEETVKEYAKMSDSAVQDALDELLVAECVYGPDRY